MRAGAELIVLCTNTMHKVAETIAGAVDVPFVHIADTTAEAVRASGPRRRSGCWRRRTRWSRSSTSGWDGTACLVGAPAPGHSIIYDGLCIEAVADSSTLTASRTCARAGPGCSDARPDRGCRNAHRAHGCRPPAAPQPAPRARGARGCWSDHAPPPQIPPPRRRAARARGRLHRRLRRLRRAAPPRHRAARRAAPEPAATLHTVVAAGSPGAIALVNDGHAVRVHAAGVADTAGGARSARPTASAPAASPSRSSRPSRCSSSARAGCRSRTPSSAGCPASCPTASTSRCASCSTSPAACPDNQDSGRRRVPRGQHDPLVVAARARRARRGQAARLRARHLVGLLEHELRAGRPDHRARDRPPPRPRARAAHLRAAAPAPHLVPGQRVRDRRRPRERLRARRRRAARRHRAQPVGHLGGRQPREHRGRHRPLLARPARRPAARPGAAGRDEDHRPHLGGHAVPLRPRASCRRPAGLRHAVGQRRRHRRLRQRRSRTARTASARRPSSSPRTRCPRRSASSGQAALGAAFSDALGGGKAC